MNRSVWCLKQQNYIVWSISFHHFIEMQQIYYMWNIMSNIIKKMLSSTTKVLKWLRDLNVYVAAYDDTPEVRRDQIVASKVYLVLLLICMLVLINYTAFSQQTINEKVENTSFTEYKRLSSMYSNTLSCSCSQIAVSLGSFISINVKFHQVCRIK